MKKNFTKEGQKLPLFGIGPYMISAMVVVTLAGLAMAFFVLKTGHLSGIWRMVFMTAGIALMILGMIIWYIGAVRSGMDKNITENKLKTTGIYAWVRNPMYSGIWILLTGSAIMSCNVWIIAVPVINWLIMTIVLIKTEEKWLEDLYGDEYREYKKRVNRCIPWFPGK